MSNAFDDLEKQVRALPREKKIALLLLLIDELEPVNEAEVKELWLQEARRRYDAYRRKELKAVPGAKAMARARKRIR